MKKPWHIYAYICLNIFLVGLIFVVLYVPHTPVECPGAINFQPLEDTPDTKGKDLLVNTSQCQMVTIDPLSPIAQHFMQPMPPHSCYKTQLLEPRTIGGKHFLCLVASQNELWTKHGVRRVREIFCVYTSLKRINDYNNYYVARIVFGFSKSRYFQEIKERYITLRVWCWQDYGRLIFHDVFMLLPEPKLPKKEKKVKPESANRLSVLILGIDSISHMHYRRYFSKTMNFVDKLEHTEMWGYNRVGENSYPNLLPLLSGQNETTVNSPTGCYGSSIPRCFDGCYFLFDFFRAAGYDTMFGEDTCNGGTFVYLLDGFQRNPVDFYLRPVMTEIQRLTQYDLEDADDISCSAGRSYPKVLDDFRRSLLPHMVARSQDTGFFGFFWQSYGVHDYFWYAPIADMMYEAYLNELHRRQLLQNTFVLLMSDHGLRFGDFAKTLQGMKEISLPTAVLIYPRWMVKRFPLAIENLKNNAHRLMTTFDLHETLKDLANLENLSDERIRNRTQLLRNDRNVSLFLPIPEERSCNSAQIPQHYCQCDSYVKIPCNVESVQRIARFVVASINELLRPYPKCQQLELSDVVDAYRRDVNESITVRLVTKPGGGRIDATVLSTNITLLQGRITRVDQYKKQAFCIEDSKIQQYCYCL